jgi:acetyl-CoA C-acetyltransferase
MSDDSRIPVIVGIGQINDRPETLDAALDPVGLMAAALRLAEEDAGGGWLADLDALSVVDQIGWPELNPLPAKLAAAIGANPRILEQAPHPTGDSPIRLLHDAANRIGAGEIRLAAVVGAEALRTAAQRASAAPSGLHNSAPQLLGSRSKTSYRGRYGLVAPVDVYPLYENAGRAAYGQTLAEGQAESGLIWSLFSQVAAENPGAWIRRPVSAEEVVTPSPANRPIAFPYNKLMVANSSVNQGAGFIVCSLALARERGVPEDRIVWIGQGAAAHECANPVQRDRFDRSPSMGVSLERTMALNELTVADLDVVELYSCFPCVPKMARRVIGWPADRPASVFGGLTFGGGPIGNYMSHAVVSMVNRLRADARTGLLFANGGYATENHSIVLTRTPVPAGTFPQDYDYQTEADAARGPAPRLAEDYAGPGTIETYTVLYNRDGSPKHGVIVARNPAGERFLAKVPAEDAAGIAFLSDGGVEPIGTAGTAAAGADGLAIWSRE